MVSWSPARWFSEHSRPVWRGALATLPVLAVTGYLWFESRHSEHLLLEAETGRQADRTFLRFQEFAATHLETIQDAANFVLSIPEDVAEARFVPFVNRLFSDKADFESVIWKQANGTVRETALVPQSQSATEPPPATLVAAAEARAATSRQPATTPSFNVRPGVEAMTIVVPLFSEDRQTGSLEGTVRLTESLRKLFGNDVLGFWNVEIYDRTGRCAFRSLVAEPQAAGTGRSFVVERPVAMGERAWKVRLWPTPLLISTLRTGAPWRILGIGLVATCLLALANFLLAQHQVRLAESLRESKRLAADFKATRRHLTEVVNGIEAAVWESDAEMSRFTFVNDYARKLLGISAEDWVSRPEFWYEHVHPDDRERALANTRAAQTPGWSYPVEYRMVSAEGAVLWVQEILTVIGEGARVLGRRSVVVDITARIQAEEALRQSQKLESLGVLAGGIAHDFNNLLTTILGNAEMLGNYLGGADSPGGVYLDKINRTTRRLAELTRQMLAYSGGGQLRVGKIDLNAVIRDLTDLLSVSIPKNVKVACRLDPDLPPMQGDVAQIRQVIMNLLTNAAEAIGDAPDGSVILRTDVLSIDADEARELYPEQEIEPGWFVRMDVSDNGSGMNEETLSKIFDPFFTTKFTGRGLGLAALRGIVRGHYGGIRIASEPGEGTVFSLVFPAVGERERLPAAVPPAVVASPIDHAHVLVVDDEEGLRSLMVAALEEAGCTVYSAADGEEGVEQFQRHRDDINVVVLDLTMPRLNGDEVFRRIRSAQPDARIILCSGYTEEDTVRHFDSRGIAGFIEKPFKPSELIEKIGSVLAEPRGVPADGAPVPASTPAASGGQNSDGKSDGHEA